MDVELIGNKIEYSKARFSVNLLKYYCVKCSTETIRTSNEVLRFETTMKRFILGERTIYIKVVFLKIGEIDTLKENFSGDVFIQARWHEPALAKCKNVERIQWESYWDPKLLVSNVLSETKHSSWKVLQTDPDGQPHVIQKFRINATFSENLELALFPFDIQDLSVLVSTERSEAEVEIVEETRELCSIHVETFAKQQEWHLHEFVECSAKLTTKEYSNSKQKTPGLIVSCVARRRAGFFIWNVLVTMTLISSLSLATFSVNRHLPQNRLQLSFTLVLTGVAFKFVANQTIPKISYLTQLDRYILGSMVFLYFICAWHAIVTLIPDEDTGNLSDKWAFIAFAIVFILFQVFFILGASVSGYKRWKHVNNMDKQYQEKAKRILGDGYKLNRGRNLFKKRITKVGNLFL